MEYVEIVMTILGGMGALLMGIHMLSENLTRLAHSKLRNMLNKTAKSRFAGVGIGAAVTVIGQSSAFTTIMVVGLVNAGIMTLFQATAIIMGANVGTTLTLWVLSLGDIQVTTFFLCLTAVGVFMRMFSNKEKVKSVGNALSSFGLIFVGLKFMSSAFSEQVHPQFFKDITWLLGEISRLGALTPFLFLVVGILLTALVQSSTAVNSIILAMTDALALALGEGSNTVYFMIIGANIGTCVTALISSLGASPNAKRAALIHFLFNLFGAIIFTVILLSWSGFAKTILVGIFRNSMGLQIAMFHTLFNTICTLLFLPFVSVFVKLANLIIRDKHEKPQETEAGISADLDERLMRSPSVALGHIYQETGKLFSYAMDTLNDAFGAFLSKDVTMKDKVLEQNAGLAKANKIMVEYLVKLSASSLVMEEEKTISNLHYVLNDITRIGELADNVTKYTNHYVNDKLVFSNEILDRTKEMYEKIKNLYVLSLATFLYKDYNSLGDVDKLEDEIDREKRQIVAAHIQRLNEGKCQPENSSVFINLVGNLERAADHITFIAHSIESQI